MAESSRILKGGGKGKTPAPPAGSAAAPPPRASAAGTTCARPWGAGPSLAEQLAAKSGGGLRSVEKPVEKKYFEDTEAQRAEYLQKYFASAADKWMFLPGVAVWTFETKFLELSSEAAKDLVDGRIDTPSLVRLKEQINAMLAESGWSRAFCKLTTFSAKDSPLVLQEAQERMLATNGLERMSGPQLLQLLNECMTESLCVEKAEKALLLLSTSPRVKSDLVDAMAAPGSTDDSVPNLCLRRWDGALPIHTEFRGFVWEGRVNAMGQYVYNMYFEELQDASTLAMIERDLLEAWAQLGPLLAPKQPTCIIDFAWNPDGFPWAGGKKVVLIEVNPFDGSELGMSELTTGIFKLRDNPQDLEIVKNGPFELRVKRDKMTEEDFQCMKVRLPPQMRAIFDRIENQVAQMK